MILHQKSSFSTQIVRHIMLFDGAQSLILLSVHRGSKSRSKDMKTEGVKDWKKLRPEMKDESKGKDADDPLTSHREKSHANSLTTERRVHQSVRGRQQVAFLDDGIKIWITILFSLTRKHHRGKEWEGISIPVAASDPLSLFLDSRRDESEKTERNPSSIRDKQERKVSFSGFSRVPLFLLFAASRHWIRVPGVRISKDISYASAYFFLSDRRMCASNIALCW